MSMQEQVSRYINDHRDGIKMALVHGNLDEAIKVIFSAGYSAGVDDAMTAIDIVVDSYQEQGE